MVQSTSTRIPWTWWVPVSPSINTSFSREIISRPTADRCITSSVTIFHATHASAELAPWQFNDWTRTTPRSPLPHPPRDWQILRGLRRFAGEDIIQMFPDMVVDVGKVQHEVSVEKHHKRTGSLYPVR